MENLACYSNDGSFRITYDHSAAYRSDAAQKSEKERAVNNDKLLLKQFENMRLEILKGSHIDHRIKCVISKSGVNLGSINKFYAGV